MGTNYYVIENKCGHCGRSDSPIHLGKSSMGWKFCLQLNDRKYYKDLDEMKEWTKDKKIENEYGENISYKDFWKIVKSQQNSIMKDNYVIKIGGYNFLDCEFC